MADAPKDYISSGKAKAAEKLKALASKKEKIKASETYYGPNTGGMGPAKQLDPE